MMVTYGKLSQDIMHLVSDGQIFHALSNAKKHQ